MALLQETQRALEAVSADNLLKSGMHPSGNIRVGAQGLYISTEAYDPVHHSPFDIDVLSPFAAVYEEDQVTITMPERPLSPNLVIDTTNRQEHPVFTDTKVALAGVLGSAIREALPGINDCLYRYAAIEDDRANTSLPPGFEPLEVTDAGDFQAKVARLAFRNLTFVVSDFSKWDFDEEFTQNPLHNIVAVKVNHPAESFLPSGLGFVPIGEGKTVNTDNPRKRNKANAELEVRHNQIVSGLEAAGARVASVIAAINKPLQFDLQSTDHAIATATRLASQPYNHKRIDRLV